MGLNVQLLRESFALVVEREPALAQRFYEVLFERYPQARGLFGRKTLREQEQKLHDMLVAIVAHLDDSAWLVTELRALGAQHQGYGVTPEMYDWVGTALLETLSQAAGGEWSPEHGAAWGDAYSAIAGMMVDGTRHPS